MLAVHHNCRKIRRIRVEGFVRNLARLVRLVRLELRNSVGRDNLPYLLDDSDVNSSEAKACKDHGHLVGSVAGMRGYAEEAPVETVGREGLVNRSLKY